MRFLIIIMKIGMQKKEILLYGNENLKNEIAEVLSVRNSCYFFHYAINLENALSIAKRNAFDLIVLDSEKANQDLKEIIQRLKSHPETKLCPIIVIINENKATEVDTIFTSGAYSFISRPFHKPDLICARFQSIFKIIDDEKEFVRMKQIELTENTLKLVEDHNFLNKVRKELLICLNNKYKSSIINDVIQDIDSKIKQDSWKTFQIAFESVHHDFSKSLLHEHPKLTKSEVKLATLIKLGLSTKEISDILCYTKESLKVARCRLRGKLNLKIDQMLETYLMTI